jgi:hypothetical protein
VIDRHHPHRSTTVIDTTRTPTTALTLRHVGTLLLLLALTGCSFDRSVEPSTDPTMGSARPFEMRSLDKRVGNLNVGSLATASVVVLDSRGVGVPGIEVTFDVTSGGGSISVRTVVTGPDGIATVGSWTLGTTPGPNTLVASVPGLGTVTFERTTIVTPVSLCDVDSTYRLGTTTAAALDFTDCMGDGVYADEFRFTLAEPDAYLFTESSAAFPTNLALYAGGRLIAYSYDTSNATSSTAIKALLPAGRYQLFASSLTWSATGAYTLSSSRTSAEASGCEEVFVDFGLSTAQHIEPTDCPRAGGRRADRFTIYLAKGEYVSVAMTSQAVDPYVEIESFDPATSQHASMGSNDNAASGTTDARLVIAAPGDGYYIIYAGTAADGQVGAYGLEVVR